MGFRICWIVCLVFGVLPWPFQLYSMLRPEGYSETAMIISLCISFAGIGFIAATMIFKISEYLGA